jgi:quercetin dioxygenase-like cupin family protein
MTKVTSCRDAIGNIEHEFNGKRAAVAMPLLAERFPMSDSRVSAPADTDHQQNVNPKGKGEIIPAETDRVVELASYQQGSVVSRVLIRRSTGNVTLFAFDEGQELSEHTAPFDALVHVLEGKAEIVIAGKPFQLGAGEAILMPANQPHALRAISKFKMLLIMIRS